MSEETVQAELNQYLTLTLADELFALNINSVREILEMTDITKIPRTPDYMRGVINLRGHAVPVVDLRSKFGMPATEPTVNTCIIITEIAQDGASMQIGALADSVQEVLELGPETIDPPPRMGTSIDTDFIRGMGKHDDQFIIILDIDRVFSIEELSAAAMGQGRPPARESATAEDESGSVEL